MINQLLAEHYKWGNDCDSWVFCHSEKLSVKLESMPIGAREVLHQHLIKEQFFFIIRGVANFCIDGKITELRQNEGIYVASNTPHFIWNVGQCLLEFLVITTPNVERDRVNLFE